MPACHARACNAEIAVNTPMCIDHWAMVPLRLRDRILALRPTPNEAPCLAYVEAVREAIQAVAEAQAQEPEGKPRRKQLSLPF